MGALYIATVLFLAWIENPARASHTEEFLSPSLFQSSSSYAPEIYLIYHNFTYHPRDVDLGYYITKISKYNMKGEKIKDIETHSHPTFLTTRDNKWLYVACNEEKKIIEINMETDNITREISVQALRSMTVLGDLLYTLGFDNMVREIDLKSGKEIREIKVPKGLGTIAALKERLYCCNYINYPTSRRKIVEVNIKDGKEIRRINSMTPNHFSLRFPVVQKDRLYVIRGGNTILEINIENGKKYREIKVNGSSVNSFTIYGDRLYALCQNSIVREIDLNSGKEIRKIQIGECSILLAVKAYSKDIDHLEKHLKGLPVKENSFSDTVFQLTDSSH